MPIKMIKCNECGHVFERFFISSREEKEGTQCPQCLSIKTEQTFLGSVFAKKGCHESG